MNLAFWIDFRSLTDGRGTLVAIEGGRSIPFDIKRIYYLFALSGELSRGMHAHRKLRQVIICMAGSCRIVLDDGRNREDVMLDSPRKGLVVGQLLWREMHDFSPDCVVLVLASDHYDEDDYIRDYDEFRRTVTKDGDGG